MEKQSDQCKVSAATENWQTEQKNSCHSCPGTLYRMHDKECLAAARGAAPQIAPHCFMVIAPSLTHNGKVFQSGGPK